MKAPVQYDMFPGPTPGPEEIIAKALEANPVAIFAGFSGGDDSLATTHWAMNNVPGCQVLHINTGIGIEATRLHVRKVCAEFGWPLLEVRAKEDCGQDYDAFVRKWGFPGPAWHQVLYSRLKERPIRKVVRDHKRFRSRERVLFITGIRHDESQRRMGYGGREVHFPASGQMWANPLYWRPQSWFMQYIRDHDLPRNPVSMQLGMSGECLCGAFAAPGELALIKLVCPETHARLVGLETELNELGHVWGWEGKPPRGTLRPLAFNMAMCQGCSKNWDDETIDMFADNAA